METQTQTNLDPTVIAKEAADAAAKLDASIAVQTAVRVIKTDIKSAAGTSKGCFEVIRAASDWAEAGSAFNFAERKILQTMKLGSMSELAKISGVKQLSYVSIKNVMLAAVQNADVLAKDLQAYYDWSYGQMSKEEQATNAQEFVPDGFLNPWSSRYADTADEQGATRFNRDRRLATDALGKLKQAKEIARKARDASEKEAKAKLAATMASAIGAGGDSAPAGSGSTVQGFASGTRSSTGREGLSVVVLRELNLLTNAVHAAAEVLSDVEVIPLLTGCHDAIRARIQQHHDAVRAEAAKQGNRPVIEGVVVPKEPFDAPKGWDMIEGGEEVQTTLEPGDVAILKPEHVPQEEWDALNAEERALVVADPEAALPFDATDLDNLDAAIAEELKQQEAGNNVDPGEEKVS